MPTAAEDHENLRGLIDRMVERGSIKAEDGDSIIADVMTNLGHKMKALWEDDDSNGPPKNTNPFRPAASGQRRASGGGQYRE